MNRNVKRVEFDATLDEIVDTNIRMVQPTVAYRHTRRQYQWLFGVCVAGGLAVGTLHGDEVPSYAAIAIVSCAALLAGLASGTLGGRFYDWYARKSYLRVISEMYGRADVIHLEFELRDDALWCKSIHSEISFPWSRLVRVQDSPGSVELWFSPGLAVVRDRAFQTQSERHAFLDAVKSHLL
jgi:hypothetical protein